MGPQGSELIIRSATHAKSPRGDMRGLERGSDALTSHEYMGLLRLDWFFWGPENLEALYGRTGRTPMCTALTLTQIRHWVDQEVIPPSHSSCPLLSSVLVGCLPFCFLYQLPPTHINSANLDVEGPKSGMGAAAVAPRQTDLMCHQRLHCDGFAGEGMWLSIVSVTGWLWLHQLRWWAVGMVLTPSS